MVFVFRRTPSEKLPRIPYEGRYNIYIKKAAGTGGIHSARRHPYQTGRPFEIDAILLE